MKLLCAYFRRFNAACGFIRDPLVALPTTVGGTVWLVDRASTEKHTVVIDFKTVVMYFDNDAIENGMQPSQNMLGR